MAARWEWEAAMVLWWQLLGGALDGTVKSATCSESSRHAGWREDVTGSGGWGGQEVFSVCANVKLQRMEKVWNHSLRTTNRTAGNSCYWDLSLGYVMGRSDLKLQKQHNLNHTGNNVDIYYVFIFIQWEDFNFHFGFFSKTFPVGGHSRLREGNT